MRIVSWNVNGLRSLSKSVSQILSELNADVACFQETKISKDQMTEQLALVDGYRSYFSYCKKRAGYSGVVTYCKREFQPIDAADTLVSPLNGEIISFPFTLDTKLMQSLDCEGRSVITQFKLAVPEKGKKLLTIINLYCPCVTGQTEGRADFRLKFLQMLEERVKQLRENSLVILTGDMNIAHKLIDHWDPGDDIELYSNAPHRLWFNTLVAPDGILIDTYRHLNPSKKFAYTCWDTRSQARQTNLGTRIDYVLVDKEMGEKLEEADIHSKYLGSDHCPVSASISLEIEPSSTPPLLCSSNRFKMRQQKLTFFVKKPSASSGHLAETKSLDPFDSHSDEPPLKKKALAVKRSSTQKTVNNKQSIAAFFKQAKQDEASVN